MKQYGLHMYESKTLFYDVAVQGKKVIEWTGRIPITERGFPIAHGNEPTEKVFQSKELANAYADEQIAKRTRRYTHNPRMPPKKMTWLMKLRTATKNK